MRVAYVCTDPGVPVHGRKGASVHVQAVVRELRRRGAEVHLVAARVGGPVPAALAGVRVHPLPRVSGPPGAERERSAQESAEAAGEVLAAIHAEAPLDLVYERYALWSADALAWAAGEHVPAVLEVNAPLIDEQAEHRVLVDRDRAEEVVARAAAHAASVVCVSGPVEAWVRDRLADPSSTATRVHVVPNGVDTTTVRPPVGGRDRPAGQPLTIGFVGTLKPWHGVATLLDAVARLDRPDGTQVRVVGDGPQADALARLASELGISDRVDLVGAVDPSRMPAELARMDLAVAPYPDLPDFYFSPLKIYEYLAAGLPVLASRVGPVPQLLDHGATGVLVRPDDPAGLADALAALRDDPARRQALGRRARQVARERHDWSTVLDTIVATLPRSVGDALGGRQVA